jgi:hypothetical protein
MQRLGVLGDDINSAHSFYLGLAGEWGVPMLVIALCAMVASIRHGWKAMRLARGSPALMEARILGATVVAVTVAHAVHGFTEIVPPLFLFLALGCAIAARRHAEGKWLGETVDFMGHPRMFVRSKWRSWSPRASVLAP